MDLAEWENFILLGRGGQCLFAGTEDALHVRIVGSKRVRVDRLTSMGDVTREEARAAVESRGNFRSRYVHLLFGKPIEQALLYDLILRRDRLDIRACVEVIIKTFGQRSMRVYPPAGEALDDERLQPSEPSEQTQSPAFANQSEEEFARLLDYYHIRWAYEPTTFPLSFNKEGLLSEALSPDFLPRGLRYVHRAHHPPTEPGDEEEPEDTPVEGALPECEGATVLQERLPAAAGEVRSD